MHPWFSDRFSILVEITERWWVRALLAIWALSGVWDLALSEWIPPRYAEKLPRVYQVVAMTAGLLEWQLWVLIGAGIIAVAAIETAVRHKQRARSPNVLGGHSGHAPLPDPKNLPPRDVLLVDAMWRIVMGEWNIRTEKDVRFSDETTRQEFLALLSVPGEIRQRAFDGELPIWGRRRWSKLYELVPRDYWRNREIVAGYSMSPETNDLWIAFTHALEVGQVPKAHTTEWGDFMTNKETVDRLWPGKWKRPAKPKI